MADHKARKDKEEVYGQIAVVEPLVHRRRGKALADMIENDHQRGDSAQTVEQLVARSDRVCLLCLHNHN